jgi:hypothetical protein
MTDKSRNGMKILQQIEIDLRSGHDLLTIYVDVWENSLGHKWLAALNELLRHDYHLEKNYCFLGFADSARDGTYICDQINYSISAINNADLGYVINDFFVISEVLDQGSVGEGKSGLCIDHNRFNKLHRYFEDLQGTSGHMSPYYLRADGYTRWHIRQLNLLCHEFESWALSNRKKAYAPQWQRPSQLMCWLNSPRFSIDTTDYELFGIETINRPLGGVFVGVNKAVGKHHWEVFQDEGRDSRIGELITDSLRSQTEAAGDFDIEWANNPGEFKWQKIQLIEFRQWLLSNGFDPEDKSLTIGHPQIGQVNLIKSFGTDNYKHIWNQLISHLDVYRIRTSDAAATYDYHWSDWNYKQQQMLALSKGNPR